jgi:phosphoserine phosphatase
MLPTLSSDWSMQLYFLRPSMGEFYSQCKSRKKENSKSFKHILEDKYEALGPIKFHEIATLSLFCTIVIIWFFRKPGFMPGWTSLFKWSSIDGSDIGIATGTPTLLIVVLFFIIPADIINDPK